MKNTLRHYSLTLLIFISFNSSCFSQKAGNNKIESTNTISWKKDVKLKKSDFMGKIDTLSAHVAQTGANIIVIPYALVKGKYQYQILAKFYKEKSWLNTNSDTYNDILKHEQLHFDIAELYARKMRKKVYETKLANNVVLESDYGRIHKTLFQEYTNFQKEYDSQTGNSRKKDIQIQWEMLISKKLKELEKFSLTI